MLVKAPRAHRSSSGLASAVVLALLCAMAQGFAAARFQWSELNSKSVVLKDGEKPVLVYNHGMMLKDGVPADRTRSSYVHPLYGMDGEVLTDDFPKDHYHHRGLFWAWPHVRSDGKEYDIWTLKGAEQRFERWISKNVEARLAVLEVENGWYAANRKLATERITLKVHPANEDSRSLDVKLVITPVGAPLTLAGAEGKSYGGFTLRFAPRTDTVITTPLGNGKDDLPMTRLPWADLTAKYQGMPQPSGAAIFVPKSHPDFPPMWLTRHYGVLCLGWPGTTPQTFEPGKPITLEYRVWIHRGAADAETLKAAYGQYETDR